MLPGHEVALSISTMSARALDASRRKAGEANTAMARSLETIENLVMCVLTFRLTQSCLRLEVIVIAITVPGPLRSNYPRISGLAFLRRGKAQYSAYSRLMASC